MIRQTDFFVQDVHWQILAKMRVSYGLEVKDMKWRVDYVVGNTYKVKYVEAKTNTEAIKKAKVKNIVDLNPVDETK